MFIDNQDRGSDINELTMALMVGTFNVDPAMQTLNINTGATTFMGTITSSNVYGMNSGDQDLSPYMLVSGATTGATSQSQVLDWRSH